MTALDELIDIQNRLIKLYDSDDVRMAVITIGTFKHDTRKDIAGAMDNISDAIDSYKKANHYE